jgi:cystathionine beta-lyase
MYARMKKAFDRTHLSGLNLFGLTALEAAYTKGAAWLDEALAYLEGNRALVESFLKGKMPRVKLKHPEGTFIFWLDFRDYHLKSRELMDILINKAGVALNDGSKFGRGGEGFARLNIGCPKSQLEEGLDRIASAFADI